MRGNIWPSGRRVAGRAGHRWAGPVSWTGCLSFTHAGPSSTTCQTAQGLAGSVPVTPLLLSPSSFHPALSSSPEKPITPLHARAPWLPRSLGSRSLQEKGETRNQHCEHFEPSLAHRRGGGALSSDPPLSPVPSSPTADPKPDGPRLLQTHSRGDTPPPMPPPD